MIALEKVRESLSAEILDDSMYYYLGDATEEKLIGLMYLRWLLSLNKQAIEILFNDETRTPALGATISKNRFRFLMANLVFDDNKETRPRRWQAYLFAAFREVFEMFNLNCANHVVPDYFLSLDRNIKSHEGAIVFKAV